jgi:predicted metal-dependent peptidase
MTPRERRVEKFQTGVVFRVPFFSPGVAKLPVVFDKLAQGTACVDGQRIHWDPDWFDGLKDGELITVAAHEVSHELLGHRWRAPAEAMGDSSLWDLWNQAADHEVNLMLKEWSAQIMANGKADPFPFPEPRDAYCADPKFSGMAAEQIYAALRSQQSVQNGQQQQPAGSGGSGSVQEVSGQPLNAPGASAGPSPQPHSMPAFGQFTPPSQNTVSNNETRNDWRVTLTQCVQIAKGQGTLPAAMARLVDKLLTPRVDWVDLLRSFLREQCQDDWTFQRLNIPLTDESGFISPRLESEHMGGVVFAVDSSGSIDDELLARFRSEQQAALDDLSPEFLLDVVCDARIQRVTEYRPGESIKGDAPGGGGTDFRPVFEHCDNLPQAPKALVMLTDTCGTWPDKAPDYPVLVVCWDKNGKAPFGEVVYVED